MLTACYDAYISRFADFLWMMTDGQTDYFTPCACAWGNEVKVVNLATAIAGLAYAP